MTLGDLIRCIRPKQWAKNGFVLMAPIFARKVMDPGLIPAIAASFAAFCLASSAVYVINDMFDREADRGHPVKKNRPIASGRMLVPESVCVALVLIVGAFLLSAKLPTKFQAMIMGYLVMNVAYSWVLKRVVILDVMIIASGFVIRAVAGGLAIDVPVSHWLVLCTTMLSLFLASVKRRQELVHLGEGAERHREALTRYDVGFLDQMISISASSTLLSYSLYTVSEETIRKLGTDGLKWTLPFVLFGIFRYLFLIHVKNSDGDPTRLLFSDMTLLIDLLIWSLTVAYILSGGVVHP